MDGGDMEKNGITLVGLGPGDPFLLTRQAWDILENNPEIYLRTRQHPCVAAFPFSLQVHSFDDLYEQEGSFESVYEKIIHQILELGLRQQGVIYAVPGHPYVAEATSPDIARRARQAGIKVQVVEGVSFLGPVFTALGMDPFPKVTLIDALEVVSTHIPVFPPDVPALIAQVYSQPIASDVKLTLTELFPDEHPVVFVHAAGTPQCQVEHLPLYAIDRSSQIGMLSTLYVPPLAPATSFESFQEIVAHLRAPEGCPWDREQTHQTLRSGLLEETYEALQALDIEDPQALSEELGDLLLQIVLHAQIASEYGEFSMASVIQGIHSKIVRRHPHVFGDVKVDGVAGVLKNWENLKAVERKENGKEKNSLLDGVAPSLPALAQAEQYISRASRTGFQWPDMKDVVNKVQEEIIEVQQASSPKEKAYEIGDLLIAIVNFARFNQVDSESALREANLRFKQRFMYIEQKARSSGREIQDLSLVDMLSIWEEAKGQENKEGRK